jgi:hypothetical protein
VVEKPKRPFSKKRSNRSFVIGLLSFVVGAAILFLLVSGGRFGSGNKSGTYISSIQDYVPLFPKSPKYTYRLDGTVVDASYNVIGTQDSPILELIAHGKVLEREVYEISGDEIYLVETLGETYEKPILLLKFPFHVGEESTWEGKMRAEGELLDCKAKIDSTEDRVLLPDRTVSAVQVNVILSIRQGEITIDRKLAFWFVSGEGIVKRQFGVSERTIEK